MPTEMIKLYATGTATLHQLQPTQSFYNENPAELILTNRHSSDYAKQDQLLIKFEAIGEEYLSKRFVQANIYSYIESYPTQVRITYWMLWLLPKNYAITDRSFAADAISESEDSSYYRANIDDQIKVGWINVRLNNPIEDILNGIRFQFSNWESLNNISYVITAGDKAENRPYLAVVLDDPNIDIVLAPSSGFVDEKKSNSFSWGWETDSIGGKSSISPQQSLLEWRNGEEGEIQTIEIAEGIESYIFPANTFPETTALQWRVKVSFAEGYTAESDWATLTTIDATPTVEIISPKSVYIDGSIDNIFSWDYDISTGSAQYGAVLQYSDNNGLEWKSLGTVTGASTTYTVPANTLPAGTILWKVQATNSDGGTSEWSEPATVVVRSASPMPVVSVSGSSPRPIISWQALGQQAYQVQVGGYDSGEMYGTNKSHKVPEFLPDGPAIARVRIQNSFGIWSEWGTAEFTVVNVEIGSCVAKATGIKNWIRVSWDFVAEAERIATFYIYRDNALIGKTTESFFDDQLAWGAHAYKIRCAAGDYYAMSNEVKAKLDIKTACIAEYGVWDWLDLPVVRGRLPALSTQYTGNVTYLHFAGRALPVAEIGEERDMSWSFAFSTTSQGCAERMASLFARLVVYKDPRDGACVGVLEGQSRQSDRYGWDFSYTIRAVDHKEVVTYDV